MNLNLKEAFRAVLWVFVTGVLFCLFPIFGLLGFGIVAVIYYRKEITTTGGKILGAIVVSFIWVVFAQILLGWIFTVSLETAINDYGTADGLWGIISDSKKLSSVIFQEVLILAVAFGSLYLFLSSKAKRFNVVCTTFLALGILAYQYVDKYMPLPPECSQTQKNVLTSARKVLSLKFTNLVNIWSSRKEEEVRFDIEVGKLPFHRYVSDKKVMFAVDGKPVRTLKAGDLLLIDLSKQVPSKDEKPLDGKPIMYGASLYDDSEKGIIAEGYVTLYNLSENKPEKAQEAYKVVPVPIAPTMFSKILTLKKGQDWVKTGFVPDTGSEIYYEVILPNDCEISSLMVRTGPYGAPVQLEPYNGNNRLGRTFITIDNLLGYSNEVRLGDSSYGEVVVKATFKGKGR